MTDTLYSKRTMNIRGGIYVYPEKDVREKLQELLDRDKQIIRWARQWTEEIDINVIIKIWEKRKEEIINLLWDVKVKNLDDIFGKEFFKSPQTSVAGRNQDSNKSPNTANGREAVTSVSADTNSEDGSIHKDVGK